MPEKPLVGEEELKRLAEQEGLLELLQVLVARLAKARARVEGDPAGGRDSAAPGKAEKLTDFEKVVEVFRATGNRPLTAKAIMNAAEISRSSLSQILYKSHKQYFVAEAVAGYAKRKLWRLSGVAAGAQSGAGYPVQATLFGVEGDLTGSDASECCHRILKENANVPMSVLTITREALKRGYRARTKGPDEDEVLFNTAKSFWARLGRDERFVMVRPHVYRLLEPGERPPLNPPGAEDED